MAGFKGFSVQTFQFLVEVKLHDNRDWYRDHKKDFEDFVMKPFQDLVTDLAPFMLSIDPAFEVTPATDKTISRIYRDIRFSKDKTLFKDHMWITFRRRIADWKNSPVFYFEVTPQFYRYGMGYYEPTTETMRLFRKAIDTKQEDFLNLVRPILTAGVFELAGDTYKKVLDKSKSPEVMHWYQRKNFYLAANRKIDDLLFSPDLVQKLAKDFQSIASFYHWLWELKLFSH